MNEYERVIGKKYLELKVLLSVQYCMFAVKHLLSLHFKELVYEVFFGNTC